MTRHHASHLRPLVSPPDTAPRPPIDDLVAQEMRRRMGDRYGVNSLHIKPCVAMIGPQKEGSRSRVCHILCVETLRAGADRDRVLAELSIWAEHCDQPPRAATHAFTSREVAGTVSSVERTAGRAGLRGYGCNTLQEFCLYGDDRRHCDYHRRLRKPRQERASLLSVLDLNQWLRAPRAWRPGMEYRRRLLMFQIAALEVVKGYPGHDLITSEAELSWRAGISRSTLHRDLLAMATAGWIEFIPGLSRRDTAGHPSRGCVIRRLYPDEREDEAVANVQNPGSLDTPMSKTPAFWSLTEAAETGTDDASIVSGVAAPVASDSATVRTRR